MTPLRIVALASLSLLLACSARYPATDAQSDAQIVPPPKEMKITDREREDYLRSAKLHTPVNVAAQNVLAGPPPPSGFNPARGSYTCRYTEPTLEDFNDPLKGQSPKFRCTDVTTGVKYKVRYGVNNAEVYGQVVATRLYWALGFKAEKLYPAVVTCIDCPAEPALENPSRPTARATRTWNPVTIQFRDAAHMGMHEHQGWDWPELEKVDPARGGASRAEIDAFRLLAAFVHHIDDQQDQQEMVCLAGDIYSGGKHGRACRQPWLMVGDLGNTFGGADFTIDLADWINYPVWRGGNSGTCRPYLDDTEGHFSDLRISKAGADFLANLLRQLTQRQIRGLFEAARVDLFAPYMTKKILADGTRVPYTTDDWVAAFNMKVAQITSHQCWD